MSPVILRAGKYKFSFYASDRGERPHVHVRSGRSEAKFWMRPVELARSTGFRDHELREIERIVVREEDYLMAMWEGFFGH